MRNKRNKRCFSLQLLAGDFNAELGCKQSEDEESLGSHSFGVRNANGKELLNFCEFNEFTITNTCFQHKPSHLYTYTWEQQRKHHKNENITVIVKKSYLSREKIQTYFKELACFQRNSHV